MLAKTSIFALSAILFTSSFARGEEEGSTPFLGVRLQEVPRALSAHLDIDGGALIAEVLPDSPAAAAGLKSQDIIVKAADQDVKSASTLEKVIRSSKPNAPLVLAVLRGSETIEIEAKLGVIKTPQKSPTSDSEKRPGFLGVLFGPLSPSISLHLGLEDGVGVSVEDVFENSAADKSGIKKHDVILSVNGQKVKSTGDFPKFLMKYLEGDKVNFEWIHRGKIQTKTITLGARPQKGKADLFDPHMPPLDHHDDNAFPNKNHFLKGRFIWKDLDGKEHVIELPEFCIPDPKRCVKELQQRFKEQMEEIPKNLQHRFDKLIQKYNPHFKIDDFEWPENYTESSETVTISRLVTGAYDITVREENGVRTITVKKDGETLADKLPFDKIDTLPKEVQENVLKANQGLPQPEKITPAESADKEKNTPKRTSIGELKI